MHFQDICIIDFDKNGKIYFEVIVHPRIQALDIWMCNLDKRNRKFVGRYSADLSQWFVENMLKKMYPEIEVAEE